jgi:hypothetical protein
MKKSFLLLSTLVTLGLLNHAAFAAQSYSLFDGRSANTLYTLLSGPSVVQENSVKKLVLDAQSRSELICDQAKQNCLVTQVDFSPNRSSDQDQLLILKGEAAETLEKALPASGSYGTTHLGYEGQNGEALIVCSKKLNEKECQILINYCYMPGC